MLFLLWRMGGGGEEGLKREKILIGFDKINNHSYSKRYRGIQIVE